MTAVLNNFADGVKTMLLYSENVHHWLDEYCESVPNMSLSLVERAARRGCNQTALLLIKAGLPWDAIQLQNARLSAVVPDWPTGHWESIKAVLDFFIDLKQFTRAQRRAQLSRTMSADEDEQKQQEPVFDTFSDIEP